MALCVSSFKSVNESVHSLVPGFVLKNSILSSFGYMKEIHKESSSVALGNFFQTNYSRTGIGKL